MRVKTVLRRLLPLWLVLALVAALSLTAGAAPPDTWKVQSGDTLWSIWESYRAAGGTHDWGPGGFIDEVRRLNPALKHPDLIRPGQVLTLPGTTTGETARNVILLIGDGMGVGQVQLTRNATVGPSGRLSMEQVPVVGLMLTHAADFPVTDSAAAGSAMATGHKTNNGMIAVKPDGTPVKTLAEAAMAVGKSAGLVSTNTLYDATPAAFAAHFATRAGSEEIATQIFEAQLHVLLGGGRDRFLPPAVPGGRRTDGRNLVDEALELGYTYVTTRDELASATGSRLLGLFNNSHINYVLDRPHVNSNEPTLAEMTAKALEFLATNDRGFFLMVEGARIDHAAHAADLPGVVAEMVEFDAAVAVALEFARRHGDTLVIITGDHETFGFSVTGTLDYDLVRRVNASPPYIVGKIAKAEGGKFDVESLQSAFATYTGITDLTEEEVAYLQEVAHLPAHLAGGRVGDIIARRAGGGVIYGPIRDSCPTQGHTANPVPIYAFGPGAERFGGLLDNTELARTIAELHGVQLDP
jgi:alkaline phosphatase